MPWTPDSKILGWASSIYIYIFKKLINLFLNVLGLCHCTWGLLLVVHRLLIVVGSLAEHRLQVYGLQELERTGWVVAEPRLCCSVECGNFPDQGLNSCLLHWQEDSFLKRINLFIFNWRIIALQYYVDFCHTSTWIGHRYTYVPSLLNLFVISYPIPPL